MTNVCKVSVDLSLKLEMSLSVRLGISRAARKKEMYIVKGLDIFNLYLCAKHSANQLVVKACKIIIVKLRDRPSPQKTATEALGHCKHAWAQSLTEEDHAPFYQPQALPLGKKQQKSIANPKIPNTWPNR